MNVGGIPLAENHHGFWLLVAIVATFTVLAGWGRSAAAAICSTTARHDRCNVFPMEAHTS